MASPSFAQFAAGVEEQPTPRPAPAAAAAAEGRGDSSIDNGGDSAADLANSMDDLEARLSALAAALAATPGTKAEIVGAGKAGAGSGGGGRVSRVSVEATATGRIAPPWPGAAAGAAEPAAAGAPRDLREALDTA